MLQIDILVLTGHARETDEEGFDRQARGKHALQHLTQRGEIIARHPLAETQQLGRKDGIRIQNPLQFLQLQVGRRRRPGNHDSDQLPVAEGDQDPGAGGRQHLPSDPGPGR